MPHTRRIVLDVFSELQRARRGDPVRERQVYFDAIEQAHLADQLGFGCWWTVEHHGATEFSYSGVPELVLTVLARETERIHLGHSGVLAPFRINHPIRVAERAAFTDVISNGRMELGLARSGGTEWDAFGVDPDRSRAELREALTVIPRMWTQDTFSWKSDLLVIPERAVLPKPVQVPHPPLWQTCTSPESFRMAGELGVGVLATTLFTPLASLSTLFAEYRKGLAACSAPVGSFKNEQISVFTFMHCAATREQAIASRAAESALWFLNAAPNVFQVPRSLWIDAIRGDLQSSDPRVSRSVAPKDIAGKIDLDDPNQVIRLLNRQLLDEEIDPVEAFEVLEPLESVVIGDVASCRKKIAGYRAIGVDRLMCLMSFGRIAQQDVLASLRLTGEELIPEFSA
ncbi:MAG: LLM class flavin-dependent oxidoreductase [Deltaproteobacteria bacterium]|nr:MAG: LLM class flavin-dependent oxidoreductase [Deltaproteobacteria bacterium]